MTTFTQHLRELWGVVSQKERDAHADEMKAGLKALMDNPNSQYLIELLEGFPAEDFRAYRAAGENVNLKSKVDGQAARTEEILSILRGAGTAPATHRRRRP